MVLTLTVIETNNGTLHELAVKPTSRLNTNTAIISSFSGPSLASVKNQFLRAANEAQS